MSIEPYPDNARMTTSNVPVPDPSLLTTEALMREIAHLRELTDTADRHLVERMSDMDLRWQQRYDASNKALDAALTSAQEAVKSALTAAEKAVSKAEAAADKRYDSLLGKLDDYKDATDKVIADLSNRITGSKSRSEGLNAGWLILAAAVPMIASVIAIVVALGSR